MNKSVVLFIFAVMFVYLYGASTGTFPDVTKGMIYKNETMTNQTIEQPPPEEYQELTSTEEEERSNTGGYVVIAVIIILAVIAYRYKDNIIPEHTITEEEARTAVMDYAKEIRLIKKPFFIHGPKEIAPNKYVGTIEVMSDKRQNAGGFDLHDEIRFMYSSHGVTDFSKINHEPVLPTYVTEEKKKEKKKEPKEDDKDE